MTQNESACPIACPIERDASKRKQTDNNRPRLMEIVNASELEHVVESTGGNEFQVLIELMSCLLRRQIFKLTFCNTFVGHSHAPRPDQDLALTTFKQECHLLALWNPQPQDYFAEMKYPKGLKYSGTRLRLREEQFEKAEN